MKLSFYGEIAPVKEGIALLSADYGYEICEEGLPVKVKKAEGVFVSLERDRAEIGYSRPCEFFRALGILLERLLAGEKSFSVSEKSHFDTCGAMVDLSHGALMTVDAIKSVLRKMAIMGLNMFMLYREESYDVPEYPYFGYMRGRHTDEEIREIDDYAYQLGIEIIPAIQTLGHLSNTLHWGAFADVKDTADCLLVGEEKTYEFIDAMLRAATRPLRSRRIHIGLDETMSLGMGNYIMKHGYRPRYEIFMEHLARVGEMAKAHGLEPLIWNDMFLRTKGSTESYAADTDKIPQEVVDKIPENMQLTACSYGIKDKALFAKRMKPFMDTGRRVWGAGAVHDWHGFCVNYYHTVDSTNALLSGAKMLGIRDVFATTWGDDSTERDFFCNLLGFQLYAEHMYGDDPAFSAVVKRFDFCAKCSGDMILEIANIDNPHGYQALSSPYAVFENVACGRKNITSAESEAEEVYIPDSSGGVINPSKYLLWQDPLQGLFDVDAAKLDFKAHFLSQKEKLSCYLGRYPEFESSLCFYICLCDLLSMKADLGVRLKKCYDAKDKEGLARIGEKEIPVIIEKLEILWKNNRTLWFERHHAFGFEVLERRYGCLLMRLRTAAFRIGEYLGGRIEKIEELCEPRRTVKPESPAVCYYNDYLWTSTAWGR